MSVDGFLSNLGDALGQQFLVGENLNKGPSLGSFANKYDRTAQRTYLEQGYFRSHSNDSTPKQLELLIQDPEATVLVKKRAFASLAENFRPDLMDTNERLFLLATKTLFRTKCLQISNYEKLTKIAQVSTAIGEVDYHLLPIIFGATDALSGLGVNLGRFKTTIDKVRKIVAFNTESKYTTWQTNPNDTNGFSEGTGVIEFTTAQSINTTTSIKFSGGSFNLNFSDPYNLMKISNNDIEAAISDAANALYNNKGLQLLEKFGQQTLDLQKQQLSLSRVGRGAHPINFIVEPNTFIGKRIRAIIDVAGIEINFHISSIGNLAPSIIGGGTVDPSVLIDDPNYNQNYGQEGLKGNEKNLFINIVSAMFNQLSLIQNSQSRAKSFNSDQINDLRKKLRLHYAN